MKGLEVSRAGPMNDLGCVAAEGLEVSRSGPLKGLEVSWSSL